MIKVNHDFGVDKDKFYRIMNCALRMFGGHSDLRLNKLFNFQEIETSKEIIKLIGKTQ